MIRNADQTYEALGIADLGRTRSVEKSVGIRLGPQAGNISTTEHQDRMANMGLREHSAFLDAGHPGGHRLKQPPSTPPPQSRPPRSN